VPPGESEVGHDLRSFGRRRGRKLSPRQQRLLENVLPRFQLDLRSAAPARLGDIFGSPVSDVWLEIGFGGGEHLVWQASRHPEIGLIGCDPFVDGMVKVLDAIEERDLPNVRLYPEDARSLLRWLPAASIGRAFVLFPDPWPKKRHAKRRLMGVETFGLLARAMRIGAELRVATDVGDYARTILLAAAAAPAFAWQAESPADWRLRGADWPPTRYEAKACLQGRRGYYFRFQRN